MYSIGKGKSHPRTDHESPEGEYTYSFILPSTSPLDGCGWSTPRPGRFMPGKKPGTHCTRGWVGTISGLDRCGTSRHHFTINGAFLIFQSLLTLWNTVLLEKLTVPELAKKFPAFYGTRRFITAFTSVRNLSLFLARSIQLMTPHPIS